jgi:hypothetical protein
MDTVRLDGLRARTIFMPLRILTLDVFGVAFPHFSTY